jgi:hypothetical protein
MQVAYREYSGNGAAMTISKGETNEFCNRIHERMHRKLPRVLLVDGQLIQSRRFQKKAPAFPVGEGWSFEYSFVPVSQPLFIINFKTRWPHIEDARCLHRSSTQSPGCMTG